LEFCRSSFGVSKKNLKNIVNVGLTEDVRLEKGARAGPHGRLKQDGHSNQRNSKRGRSRATLWLQFDQPDRAAERLPLAILKRLQVFDEVVFLPVGQPKPETRVITVDDIEQRLKPPVVIKATLVLG
jgi:hypothetical protein